MNRQQTEVFSIFGQIEAVLTDTPWRDALAEAIVNRRLDGSQAQEDGK